MLSEFTVNELFAIALVFMRFGSCLMVMPGIGEAYMLARARLLLALALSFLMTPLLKPMLVAMPSQPGELAFLLCAEIITGLFIGGIARIVISGVQAGGMIIATQSGLATAMMFDITMSGQGTVVSNLLVLVAIMMMFLLDIHHIMIQGLVESYTLFPSGAFPITQDMAIFAASKLAMAFRIALQIASPFIVITILLNLGGGILARLMPTMQIFFILQAPQIMFTFFVLFASIGTMMMWYMTYVETSLSSFLLP